LVLAPTPAWGQDTDPLLSQPQKPPLPKRAMPDYDGLPPPGPDAVEVVAWVPRVALFPVWLATEYAIRQPLHLLVVAAEKGNWPSELISFFTFGNQNFGIVPTVFVDLGFRPIFGVYFFYDGPGIYSLRVRGTGTIDGFGISVANRFRTDEAGSRFVLQGDVNLAPDRAFYGIGPNTLESDISRYGLLRAGGSLSYDCHVTRGIRIIDTFGIHTNDFKEPRCCTGIPVSDLPTPPPGFPDGYTAMTERIEALFDSRPPRPDSQTGVRLRLEFEHSTDLRGSGNWVRGGGTLGGFLDFGRWRI